MRIKQILEDWKNDINPLFHKEYESAISSLAVNEKIFIITIISNVNALGILHLIKISESFITHSNSNIEYLNGDICNLNRLLENMEKDFQLQLDVLINKLDL